VTASGCSDFCGIDGLRHVCFPFIAASDR
jgi:hypothetical protein